MDFCYDFRHILKILEGKGPMSSTGIEALLYMKTNNSVDPDPEYPDVEILQAFATVAFDTCKFLITFHLIFYIKLSSQNYKISNHWTSVNFDPDLCLSILYFKKKDKGIFSYSC